MDYQTVVSFATRSRTFRHNNIYRASGFKEERITDPNYVYVKSFKVLSRYQTMKHKLKRQLGDALDSTKSEKENMINSGWLMIHDSGQLFYKWINT